MSDFLWHGDLLIPAGNGVFATAFIDLNLGWSDVESFVITFPPGCSGLVGAQIVAAHTPAYPTNGNNFFAFDDYIYTQTVHNQIQTGQWRIFARNSDFISHTLHIDCLWNSIVLGPALAISAPIAL